MMLWKKGLALMMSLLMSLSLVACGDADTTEESTNTVQKEAEETYTVRAAALKGPTAMGLVKMIDHFGVVETPQTAPLVEPLSENGGSYTFMLAGGADQISPLLLKGELDVACVPANLASVLYNKTEGQIVTLGINTLGVIYIVDKGDSVQSLADLSGKTIVAAGKGQTPEYGLRYLLAENGIDPDTDVDIQWKSEHSECVAALASGAAEIALLPQPFVTVAQGKIEGLRIALDLTAEWEALDNGSTMITGVVVARKAFVEEHPAAADIFLQDYADSVAWVNSNVPAAAELIGGYGIVDAAVAEKALPYCNIVCITGEEMAALLPGYLDVLYRQDTASVGGALPGEDFCYISEEIRA